MSCKKHEFVERRTLPSHYRTRQCHQHRGLRSPRPRTPHLWTGSHHLQFPWGLAPPWGLTPEGKAESRTRGPGSHSSRSTLQEKLISLPLISRTWLLQGRNNRTYPPYFFPHSLTLSTQIVCSPSSSHSGRDEAVVVTVFHVDDGVHGGGSKVGHGLQSGKHPPYICPQSLMPSQQTVCALQSSSASVVEEGVGAAVVPSQGGGEGAASGSHTS